MAGVLASPQKDISGEFSRGFQGMTEEPVALGELLDARKTLMAEIVGHMPEAHRSFLVSFERGTPEWALLGVGNTGAVPGYHMAS